VRLGGQDELVDLSLLGFEGAITLREASLLFGFGSVSVSSGSVLLRG